MVRASALAAILSLLASGCASGYQSFYQPLQNTGSIAIGAFAGEPTIVASTGDPDVDNRAMYAQGLAPVGVSSFNGSQEGPRGALVQAKKVGAQYIVMSQRYASTVSGAVPMTLPTNQTSTSNGTVQIRGAGGATTGNYTGTTTTYGSRTTMVPYSVDRYDQMAVYFAPLPQLGFGMMFGPVSADRAREIGTAQAAEVVAVRRGSPTFTADILPGDLILKANGVSVYDLPSFIAAAPFGARVELQMMRGATVTTKYITTGPNGEWR